MKEFICISCPMGCHLKVDDSDKSNIIVEGNTCPRGKIYGINEVTAPKRMVTSSVFVDSGCEAVCPVKTNEAIPKEMIFDVLKEIAKVRVKAPVKIGDILIENVLSTGSNIIATKNVEEK